MYREFGSQGYTVEHLARQREVANTSTKIQAFFNDLPEDDELTGRDICVRRDFFANGLTPFAVQRQLSFDVSHHEAGDMPPALLAILPDIVDSRDELRITLLVEDVETYKRKGYVQRVAIMGIEYELGRPNIENPGFAMVLGSQNPQSEKVTVGIPSDFEKGLFVVTKRSNGRNEHPRNQVFEALRSKPVSFPFDNALVYGAEWVIRTVNYRLWRFPEDAKIVQFPLSRTA